MSDNTDDAPVAGVLKAILECVYSWEGSARLLGNIRAVDIGRACRAALDAAARIAELEATLREERAQTRIAELEAEVELLTATLRPFAEQDTGLLQNTDYIANFASTITVGDLRRAYAVVSRLKDDEQYEDDVVERHQAHEAISKAREIAAQDKSREELAQWMIANSYATGHGDTIEDLLGELKWQVEAERDYHPTVDFDAEVEASLQRSITELKAERDIARGRHSGALDCIAELEAENKRLTAMVAHAQHALDEVGAGIARRVAEEREACAKLADPPHPQHFSDWTEGAKIIAAAIRARPAP